ncbi:MAG: hypothetical protein ACK56F_09865, partial [bacterium]
MLLLQLPETVSETDSGLIPKFLQILDHFLRRLLTGFAHRQFHYHVRQKVLDRATHQFLQFVRQFPDK